MANEIQRFEKNAVGNVMRTSSSEALQILAEMFAMFQVGMEGPTINGYVLHLQDIPAEGLRAAVARCIKTCEFMPTVAHIRNAYQDIRDTSGEYRVLGSVHLTQEEIAKRPLPPTKVYRETQAERLAQLRKYRRDGDDVRGGRRGH